MSFVCSAFFFRTLFVYLIQFSSRLCHCHRPVQKPVCETAFSFSQETAPPFFEEQAPLKASPQPAVLPPVFYDFAAFFRLLILPNKSDKIFPCASNYEAQGTEAWNPSDTFHISIHKLVMIKFDSASIAQFHKKSSHFYLIHSTNFYWQALTLVII